MKVERRPAEAAPVTPRGVTGTGAAYIDAFPFRDRLRDVLAWALVSGRLADVEADQVEACVTGDVRAAYEAGWRQGRLALALLWPALTQPEALDRAGAA